MEQIDVVAKAALYGERPLLKNDSLMPLCSQCHHREECSLSQTAPWKQVCQRDLGTKAHQTGSKYQAMVFVSKAGPAALFFLNITEPCLFLSTGIWVTKQMKQGPPSMKPQEEPGYALGRGSVLSTEAWFSRVSWGEVLGTPALKHQPWELRKPDG